MVKSGQIYRHYNGNLYDVVTVAQRCDTLEQMVVYRSVAEPSKVWVRSLAEFKEVLGDAKGEGGTRFYRFQLLSDLAV